MTEKHSTGRQQRSATDENQVPSQRADLDDQLRTPSPQTRIAVLDRHYRDAARGPSFDWLIDLADVVTRNALPLAVVRRVTSDLAWQARDAGQAVPSEEQVHCARAASPDTAALVLAYVRCQRLRFDFKFEQLDDACDEALQAFVDDGLIQAFAAFASLGMRSDESAVKLSRAKLASDRDRTCRYVQLHGLWFGTHLPDQAKRILAVTDEIISLGEDDYNTYYWRSFALRTTGSSDEALRAIDRALSLLPEGNNTVHQDYVRERELIRVTKSLDDHFDERIKQANEQIAEKFRTTMDEARAELTEQSRSAQELVSGSLLSLVEVLGLFVTLAGFLIASGTIAFHAGSFWQHFWSIVLLLAGAIAFFLLLRGIVGAKGSPAGRVVPRSRGSRNRQDKPVGGLE